MSEFKEWFKDVVEECQKGNISAGVGLTAFIITSPILLILWLITKFYGWVFSSILYENKK